MASPGLKKLAAKVASGEPLTDQEMNILDKFEASSVKMTDMVNAQGASGVGKAGAELTLNTGEKLAGDAAAQAANGHFDAIQDLKSQAVELAGNTKYGGAGDIAGKAADVATDVASKPFGAGMASDYLQRVVDAGGKSGVRFKISPEDAAKALAWKAKQGAESLVRSNRALSEGQVYLVFNRVCTLNNNIISEGPMDAIKGFAGKAMDKARTIGTNLTTKITADKLNSAWQKAGAPTDSEELKNFLTGQKVDAAIVDTVYKSLKITNGKAQAATSVYSQVKTDLATLDKKGKQRLAAYLQKQLGTVK